MLWTPNLISIGDFHNSAKWSSLKSVVFDVLQITETQIQPILQDSVARQLLFDNTVLEYGGLPAHKPVKIHVFHPVLRVLFSQPIKPKEFTSEQLLCLPDGQDN